MDIVSYSHARQKLASILAQVARDREPVIITRQGAENLVLMLQSEFEGWQETVNLLSSPANAQHLQRSIAQLDAGQAVEWPE